MTRIFNQRPCATTLPASIDRDVRRRRTQDGWSGRLSAFFADRLASLSTALLWALSLCPGTHRISNRTPRRIDFLTRSFQRSALITGVPSRVIHFALGHVNLAFMKFSATYKES